MIFLHIMTFSSKLSLCMLLKLKFVVYLVKRDKHLKSNYYFIFHNSMTLMNFKNQRRHEEEEESMIYIF